MLLLQMCQDSKQWNQFGYKIRMILQRVRINESEWFVEEKIQRESWGWSEERITQSREKNLGKIVAAAYLKYLYDIGVSPIFDLEKQEYDCIIPDDFQASMLNSEGE